jgi:hypothetical protein
VRCRWRISVAPLDRRRDHAKGGKIHRVAVARDHLGRDRLRRQTHRPGDVFFHARVDLRKGADSARDRACRDILARGDEAFAGAAEFGIGVGELQPERHRLGVNGMGAADGRRHFVLEGAPFQRRQNLVDIRDQDIRGAAELHIEASVEHVGRSHALMHEARFGADDFGQMGEERDHVVMGFALDFVDPRDVERRVFSLGPDRLRGFLGDHAEFSLRIRRMRFDLEPDLEAGLWLPNGSHFRTGVAGDHRRL